MPKVSSLQTLQEPIDRELVGALAHLRPAGWARIRLVLEHHNGRLSHAIHGPDGRPAAITPSADLLTATRRLAELFADHAPRPFARAVYDVSVDGDGLDWSSNFEYAAQPGPRMSGTAGFALDDAACPDLAQLANETGVGKLVLLMARHEKGTAGSTQIARAPIAVRRGYGADEIFVLLCDAADDEEQTLVDDADRFVLGELVAVEIVGRVQYRLAKSHHRKLLSSAHERLPKAFRPTLADLERPLDLSRATDATARLALAILAHAVQKDVDELWITERDATTVAVDLDQLAWHLYEDGRLDELLAVIARRAHLANARDHLLAAQFLQLDDCYEEALVHANRTIELAPADASAYLGRGTIRHFLKDFHGALGDYDRCEALAPADADDEVDEGSRAALFRNRGEVHLDLGHFELARKDLERAAKLDPKDKELRSLLARAVAGSRPRKR